jgi:uncharacterized protein
MKAYRTDLLGTLSYSKKNKNFDSPFKASLTPEGFLRLKGRIARTGNQLYFDASGNEWIEHRPAEEVFRKESMQSFEMAIVTDDHPPEMVTVENVDKYKKGILGSQIVQDGIFLIADILITDKKLIQSIMDGLKVELSCGYFATILDKAGFDENGQTYDKIQTEIEGNHVAVVEEGRAGPECKLFISDSATSRSNSLYINKEDSKMKTKRKDEKLMIGEMEHEVPEAVATAYKELMAKVEEQGAELAKLAAKGDEEEGEEKPEFELKLPDPEKDPSAPLPVLEAEMTPEELEAKAKEDKELGKEESMDALRARIDTLTAQVKEREALNSARIDARVNLVTNAKSILGKEFNCDGVCDSDVMKAVASHVTPSMKGKLDGKSCDYIKAAYDMALMAMEKNDSSNKELLGIVPSNPADNRIDSKLEAMRERIYNKGKGK